MVWYDPQEIKDEANDAQRQPEFDLPEIEAETPIVEGSLAVDGAQKLIDRQNEVVDVITTEITNGPEHSA